MIPLQVDGRVVENRLLTNGIYLISLEIPEIASRCKAGQFVMVTVHGGNDPLLRRPFSIHRAFADNGTIQLLYRRVGRGTGMLSKIQKGSNINILGPLGKGFSLPSPGQTVCLTAGGMGIAPLIFLATEIARQGLPEKAYFLYGARNAAELVQREIVSDLGYTVLITTEDGSAGTKGRVPELLSHKLCGDSCTTFSCGPMPMLAAVAKKCARLGWRCQVSLETSMACGIAACLGCAVARADDPQHYWHVCKDGPVFNAEAIQWPTP